MKADDKFDPPFELPFSSLHPSARFNTPTEVLAWVQAEREWLQSFRNEMKNAGDQDPVAISEFSVLIKRTATRFESFQQLITRDVEQLSYTQAFSIYVADFTDRRLIHSGSRIGVFLTELRARDPYHAVRIMMAYCDVRINLSSSNQALAWARAASAAVLLERGLYEGVPNLDPLLEQFTTRWGNQFEAVAARQAQVASEQAVALSAFQNRAAEGDAFINEYRNQANTSIMDGRAELLAITEAYKTAMTLQAPTTYWTNKKNGHAEAASRWAYGFGAAAVVGGLFVWKVWTVTADPVLRQYGAIKDVAPPSFGIFLPTAAAAFLVVWVLRILSRQLLTNLSLGSDASERVAMVETFLSLMQKPEHVQEQDRILILASLFRPASSSNDDATPPNWFDLLMQRVKPDKS